MRTYVEEEIEEKETRFAEPDSEITLGMKSLLGVFFGSVLICGVFFGFGYSLGRGFAKPDPDKATAPPRPAVGVAPSSANSSDQADSATPQATPSTTGAAAGGNSDVKTVVSDSSAIEPNPSAIKGAASDGQYEYVATPDGPARRPAGAPPKSKPHAGIASTAQAVTTTDSQASQPRPLVQQPALTALPPARPAPSPVAPAAVPAAATLPKTSPTGTIMVQVAAISRAEDADILVSALRKRGYPVVVRSDPKDTLRHVQIGPFAGRDDAKAMRAKLLGDGYNAIIK